MVGILVSFWEGLVSGAMLVLGRVTISWSMMPKTTPTFRAEISPKSPMLGLLWYLSCQSGTKYETSYTFLEWSLRFKQCFVIKSILYLYKYVYTLSFLYYKIISMVPIIQVMCQASPPRHETHTASSEAKLLRCRSTRLRRNNSGGRTDLAAPDQSKPSRGLRES